MCRCMLRGVRFGVQLVTWSMASMEQDHSRNDNNAPLTEGLRVRTRQGYQDGEKDDDAHRVLRVNEVCRVDREWVCRPLLPG